MHEDGRLVVTRLAQGAEDQRALLLFEPARSASLVPREEARRHRLHVTEQVGGRGALEAQVDEQRLGASVGQDRERLRGRVRRDHLVPFGEEELRELFVLVPIFDDQQPPHARGAYQLQAAALTRA